jgi:hypothetical protein
MFLSANGATRVAAVLFLLAVVSLPLPLAAQGRRPQSRPRSGPGSGDPDEPVAPWRFVEKGDLTVTTPFALVWFPATNQEMDRSPLLASTALTEDTGRCVSLMAVVPPNDVLVAKLGVTGTLPAAVLVDRSGNVIRRLDHAGGTLKPAAVEHLVAAELGARDEGMFRDITAARKKADAGEKEAAVALYRKIWDDRCLYPLAGQEAQGALKSLGVTVEEPATTLLPDPNLMTTPAKKPKKGKEGGNGHD